MTLKSADSQYDERKMVLNGSKRGLFSLTSFEGT